MSVSILSQMDSTADKVIRRSANFHPTVWGNHFLSYASMSLEVDSDTEQQIEKLKEEVKRMLTAVYDNASEKLQLIDDIQRLGFSYHFVSQIHEILRDMHKIGLQTLHGTHNFDLYTVSQWFRLVRQAGFNIPSDVFKKFTNKEGKFNKALASDAKGMLSLYEAAQLRVHGEQILEEALTFTTTHLSSSSLTLTTTKLSPPLAAQIKHALKQPIWKAMPRAEARHFISLYQQDSSRREDLLTFAKLDFNILQRMHQKELADITKWWNDLIAKLPFARDRIVEGYLWGLGVYYEPQYSLARKLFTKVIAMSSIIDDMYDVHGTHEELLLFTDAIERWDLSCMDQLPNYMKCCYEELLNVYKEIEDVMSKEGRAYRADYAIEEMKKLVRVYVVESKWFSNNYIPTLEEYLPIGLRSCGFSMLTITSFIGMGDIVTKEGFDWILDWPKILQASSIICRLTDDVVGHKFEQERGHVASSVECYVNQHGVSEKEAYIELRGRVMEAWKYMNEEWIEPKDVPLTLLERVVNLARMIDLLYKESDGYTHSGGTTKKIVTSLLVDPIPI